MKALRAGLVLVAFAVWTLLLLPVQMLAVRFGWHRLAQDVPMLYHRGLARLLRVRVQRLGTPSPVRPTLYVVNHVSWLDIVVLDTLLKASFIAKHEIARWPLFGLLARLQRSVFIERKARRTADHRDEMTMRIEAGDSLILFPEGTSSDGLRLLPFKSAFFSLAEQPTAAGPLTVQPVSIVYNRLAGMPVGRRAMSVFAWIGDQDLVSHLWQFLQAGPSAATVVFHPAVTIADFPSRKALSAYCQETIARGMSVILAGRDPESAIGAPPPGRAPIRTAA